MSWEWREQDGVRYLVVDYRGCTADAMLALLENQVREVVTAAPGARVLIVVDPNYTPDHRFLDAVKRAYRDKMLPAEAKVAYVGVSGLGSAVLRGLQLMASELGSKAFADEKQALDYLTR